MRKNRDSDETSIIDKTQVLQEAKQYFMATNAKTKKLVDVLTKTIFILLQGERLTSTEATDLFFHITRLFQYKDKDSTLRRLTYIGIKALSQQADNVYVVTSSLTTDVNSNKDDAAIRASALRALCQISDASTFTTIERYLKQSVVDKYPVVASSALSSLIKIAQINGDIVRRCTNEIQEALNSDSPMVQYHALALRYVSCRSDRLSISRLIANCTQQGLKSPLAICLLIRIMSKYIHDHVKDENIPKYLDFIKDSLNHRSDMVECEASSALVEAAKRVNINISSVVDHLSSSLSSSKPALRFAAVRSLNQLATICPQKVNSCNLDLERLISQSDCNRSIAILAITTLLKTGQPNRLDRLLKQIGEFLSEIDDGFKVIVVGSVRQFCTKFPDRHLGVLDFLSNMLREEGGRPYKRAIVDTIIKIIEDNEKAREKGLEQLCEFVEDCEHVNLAVEVLNVIGREGPKTNYGPLYVRYLANRLLLDPAPVACAAASALAKFAVHPALSESVKIALDRYSLHEDYEVMERTLFYKNLLTAEQGLLFDKLLVEGDKAQISYQDLESKLMSYIESDCSKPFNISNVAKAERQEAALDLLGDSSQLQKIANDQKTSRDIKSEPETLGATPAPPLNVFDEFDLGALKKTVAPISLTDSVSEFGVICTRHIYHRHIVFQFDCSNTVDNMQLENVGIEMCPPQGFNILASTEYPTLAYDETVPLYVCVELVDESCCAMDYFTNINLKYNYRNVDPDSKELIGDDVNEDVFPLEDMLIDLSKILSSEHLKELGWEIDQEL